MGPSVIGWKNGRDYRFDSTLVLIIVPGGGVLYPPAVAQLLKITITLCVVRAELLREPHKEDGRNPGNRKDGARMNGEAR